MSKQNIHKQETVVYSVLWATMFIAPLISIQFHYAASDAIPWEELLAVWKQVVFLFVAFLLHNFLLAPLLIFKQKRLLYFSCIALLTGCFVLIQCADRPERFHQSDDCPEHHEIVERHEPPLGMEEPFDEDLPEAFHRPPVPPFIFGQHDLMATVILILMLGMNLGVKLYFKQQKDNERLHLLEKENLQQQLEYLRYQINPHFLMNTLNNIHALVDIDGERAKETIVELSKIMRYALYEGSRQTVPIRRDIDFMESYIKLMRLRYTDKVSISVSIARELPDCDIPPMMFITFVENAFKHGISYQQESFIDISLGAKDNRIFFTCRNSKPQASGKNSTEKGGVGLLNIQRRLQLIYGTRYRLNIDDQKDQYNIQLEIPL
jgi:sensor histidine kinase YesM